MSLESFVHYLSVLCAQRGVSLHTIGRRHGWSDDAVADLLKARSAPTQKLLRDLASELGVRAEDLKDCLPR